MAPCERSPLKLDPLAIVGIAPADDLVDEAAVGIEVAEVAAAAQKQRILQRLLEMAVRALNGCESAPGSRRLKYRQ